MKQILVRGCFECPYLNHSSIYCEYARRIFSKDMNFGSPASWCPLKEVEE